MSITEDWRYRRLSTLAGTKFSFVRYKAPADEWDHDHCEGCWAKFANLDAPDILHEGYVARIPYEETPEPSFITECKEHGMHCIPQPAVDGYELLWVCSQCFEDFRDSLNFTMDAPDASAGATE